jgi:curli biogenesis system outer membrane secretion channel CsgG
MICILSLPFAAQARVITETSTKSSHGEGVGVTREDAINKAIVEALSKLQGVKINSVKSSSIFMGASSQDGTVLVDAYKDEISKATNGRVDSYEINSITQDADGRYIANVTIFNTKTTKRYQAPGLSPDSRRNIIVLGSSRGGYHTLSETLKQKFISKFVQSRKFNVLDRQHSNFYAMERAFIQSGNAMSDEIYKLGNGLSTDYMFVYTVTAAKAHSKTSNLTGREKIKAELSIDYQVILFATRQVKFSNTLNIDADLKDGGVRASHDALDRVVRKITNQVLDAIYPLCVADIINSEAVFSQELANGDTYECFSEGAMIRDAYTKENTGRVESRTGAVEVVRATNKLSYAKITEGTVVKGNICRSLGSSAGYSEGREANYQLHESGGVQLGF